MRIDSLSIKDVLYLAKVFNKFTEWRLLYFFFEILAMELNNTRMDRIEFLLYLGFFLIQFLSFLRSEKTNAFTVFSGNLLFSGWMVLLTLQKVIL